MTRVTTLDYSRYLCKYNMNLKLNQMINCYLLSEAKLQVKFPRIVVPARQRVTCMSLGGSSTSSSEIKHESVTVECCLCKRRRKFYFRVRATPRRVKPKSSGHIHFPTATGESCP